MTSSLIDRVSVRLPLMDTICSEWRPTQLASSKFHQKTPSSMTPFWFHCSVPLLHSSNNFLSPFSLSLFLSLSLFSLSFFSFYWSRDAICAYRIFIHAHLQSRCGCFCLFKTEKLCALLLSPAPRGADAWNLFQIVMPFDVTPLKECVPSERHTLWCHS